MKTLPVSIKDSRYNKAMEKILGHTTQYYKNVLQPPKTTVEISSQKAQKTGMWFFKNSLNTIIDFWCQK